MQKRHLIKLILVLLVIILSACNMPNGSPSPAEQTAIIERSVAETVAAGPAASLEADDPTATDTPDTGSGEPATPLLLLQSHQKLIHPRQPTLRSLVILGDL